MSGAIKLNALDTLFFRDGKPFSMGDESWAEGVFPPFPSVLYGALRTAFFAENGNDFEKAGLYDDPTKRLVIENVYLKSEVNSLFPMPLDFLKSEASEIHYHLLKAKNKEKLEGVFSNCATPYALMNPSDEIGGEKLDTVDNILTDKVQLIDYLHNEKISRAYSLGDFITREPKVGIGRDRYTASSSDTGMLYRINMSRPATLQSSLSIVVEYSGLDLSGIRLLKLGGEGRSVSCLHELKSVIEPPDVKVSNEEFFKIYLATPAIFNKGWYPELENVDILAAAVGRRVPVGGFNMRSKYENGKWKPFPKPLRYAVPAGSVYYCKGNMQEAIKRYHVKESVSEERSEEGFGIAYIGKLTMEI